MLLAICVIPAEESVAILISAMLEDGEGRERKEEVVAAGGAQRERDWKLTTF